MPKYTDSELASFEKNFLNYKPAEVPEELRHLPDRVSESFAGKTIFITGGSGFLGKVLVEKLLRKCPNVERIYLLLRTKKGSNPKQRIDTIFSSVLFDLVKEMHGPEVINKVIAIAGDVTESNLAISESDRQLLADTVQIVYHAAATIRFDESLRKAVLLNTRGTKLVLELAKEMKQLEAFMHVSTSYCHLDEKVLFEKAYPPPVDPHKIIQIMELLEEPFVESIAKQILGSFPNTYAFTKCLSEHLVVEQMKAGLPCLIARPSIVIPVWKEPLPGWTDNINGPTGLLIGAGKGVIRTMYCDNSGYADYLPVDITVNGILLFTWNYIGNKDKTRQICHLTSSQEWRVTWQEIIDIGKSIVVNEVPLNGAAWYPGGSMKSSKLLHNICVFFMHTIPAYFLDAIIFMSGNKPCLVRIQDRINKGFEVFEYYANNQWEFRNEHVHYIRRVMNAREKFEYTVDGDDMDIRSYFRDCIMAARIYILKEMPDTLPRARIHMKIMYCVDIVAKILFFGLLLWTLFSWSDTIVAFGIGLINIIRLCFGSVLSAVTGNTTADSILNNKEL
ncbi:Male sterility, NAD-binding,NAD(P)-binding domain,Fatty acyl-CoA reductase, C-terminal [Cinara cedri]|uniref:Fatty acyl-CoA reductase n=1 Tax=Cinara cedri TaxID=506608 RepID=A0A5E4N274_9HEMI|nr:Male sterility, NAD-binding,NAD(P)-binding domain,Fatty acyl-CoA reductase, C-terminal [Cinara cedri]